MPKKTQEQIVAEHKVLTDQTIRKMLDILVSAQKEADAAEYRGSNAIIPASFCHKR